MKAWFALALLIVPVPRNEDLETRSFDLRPLVLPPERTHTSLVDPSLIRPDTGRQDGVEELAEFLMTFPGSDEASWAVTDGQLQVEAKREVLDYVGGMVEALRSRLSASIRVRGRFVRVSPEAWFRGDDPLKSGEVLADAQLDVTPGRRSGTLSLRRTAYVGGYSSQIAQDSVTQTPTIAHVRRGARLDLRAGNAPGGALLVEVDAELVILEAIEKSSIQDKRLLELPRVRIFAARTTVPCRPGEATVAAAGRTEDGVVCLVLTAERIGSGRIEPLPKLPRGGLEHQLVDVSAYWIASEEPAAPALGQEGGEEEEDASFTITEPVSGASDTDAIDLVKSVRPESWINDAEAHSLSDVWVYVRNRTEVVAEVEQELRKALDRRIVPASSSAWLVVLPQAALDAWDRKAEVSAETVAKWLREGALAGGAEVRGVRSSRSLLQTRTRHAYIAKYEALVATGKSGEDPVVGFWNEGTVLDVRVTGEDAKTLVLEGGFSWARLEELRKATAMVQGGDLHLPDGRAEEFPLNLRSAPGSWRAEARRVGDREFVLIARMKPN